MFVCVLLCGGFVLRFLFATAAYFLEVLSISTKEVMINDQIRAKEVRVIDSDGTQLGILPLKDALHVAYGKDLDLVEISPNSCGTGFRCPRPTVTRRCIRP